MEERFKNDVDNFQNAESRIMGDFKGTKGEWHLGEDSWSVYDSNGFSVAEVDSGMRVKGHWSKYAEHRNIKEGITFVNVTDEESEANAQLIATAPKLLVELYQMTLLLKALPENNSEMRERIESAEKTIKKALGL